MTYLAHIADDRREQTVAEHLQGTADLAARFAAAFGAEADGRFAGLLHDIGKYTPGFQKRLHGGPPVDHSTAGAREAFSRYGNAPPRWPSPDTTAAFRTPETRTTRPMNRLCSGV